MLVTLNSGLNVTQVSHFNANDLDFNFKDTETQKIANIVTGHELKVDENNPNVILMRLNRFPRHGITCILTTVIN